VNPAHTAVEIITFAMFVATIGILLTVSPQRDGIFGAVTKWSIIAALSTLAIKSGVSAINQARPIPELMQSINSLELLFVPLLLLAAESAFQRQQLLEIRRAQREAERARELAMHLMDTTPSGILVLDESGDITYANETACAVLDLVRGTKPGEITGPGWTVRDLHGHEAPNFLALAGKRKLGGVPVRVTWPGGTWLVDLVVTTAPLDADRSTVAAFPMPSRTLSAFNGESA
jgi:PAS domain-containing protein